MTLGLWFYPISSGYLRLDHMGTPLKNQNFENWASSCFKMAKIKFFFTKVLFLPKTRAKKKLTKNFLFFIRATPLKNGNFSNTFFLHLLILKIFTLSKFHSPMCRNGRNFTKKPKKRPKNRKIAVKRGKNANFEKRFSFFFKLVQFWLKFQISGSSDV